MDAMQELKGMLLQILKNQVILLRLENIGGDGKQCQWTMQYREIDNTEKLLKEIINEKEVQTEESTNGG